MTRGVWVAAVALSLSGLSGLYGQETTWRPAVKPTEAPAPSGFGVTLGRPVPIIRGSSAALEGSPRPLPATLRDGVPMLPHEREALAVQPIATVPPPGALIAASGPAAVPGLPVPDAEEPPNELFAMDRPQPRQPGVGLAANWTHTQPVEPPLDTPQQANAPPAAAPAAPPPGPPGEWWDGPSLADRGPSNRFYVRGEYLLWWLKQDKAPPLVTTGDFGAATLTPGNISLPGTLNRGDTVVLFGGNLTNNPFSGGRFTAGMYLDDCGDKAIEVGGFFLGQRSKDFAVTSAQVPFLARPFFAANPGPRPDLPREFIEIVSAPGAQAGSVRIHAPSQLWGLNADWVCKVCCGCDYRINAFAGGRYLNLRESLTITEDNTLIRASATSPAGTRFLVSDSFATRNEFYGGEVGVNGRWYFGRFDLNGVARVALGSTKQTVEINGSQTVIQPNGMTTQFRGGLLALPSNIGSETRDRFSVVPELGLSVGYNVTNNVRLSVGYNFLYWSSVVRPGDQVNRNLDVLQIPNFTQLPSPPFGTTLPTNPTQPQRPFRDTDFWAHGVTVGVEIKF